MSTSHWGDLATVAETDFDIAVFEREQLIKPRSMDVDGPRLYQPSSQHRPPATVHSGPELKINPVIKHTIELNQYAAELQKMINFVQQQYSTECVDEVALPATPDLPPFQPPLSSIEKSGLLPYLYKDVDKPVEDLKVTPLDEYHCRKLTRHAVALLMAHTGLETCPSSILETMTDLCGDYIRRMATSLRRARDREAMTGRSGFPDIISHVFHETGIGEVTKIHDFYQERVVGYHKYMLGRCRRLRDEYEKVKSPEYRNTSEFKAAIMKVEVMSDLQFSSFIDEDLQFNSDQHSLLMDVDEASRDERWLKTEPKMINYDSVLDDGSPTIDFVVRGDSGVSSSIVGQPLAKIRKIE